MVRIIPEACSTTKRGSQDVRAPLTTTINTINDYTQNRVVPFFFHLNPLKTVKKGCNMGADRGRGWGIFVYEYSPDMV
jgi:hypothetical protein